MTIDLDFRYATGARQSIRPLEKNGLDVGARGGRPSMRIPDYCCRGQVLDVRSQWLINNMTDEQRAYARELAIERKKQRERRA